MPPGIIDINNLTTGALPRAPFADLVGHIFPKKYELSLTFVTPANMRKLSQAYKGDPTHMNVLSFPLSKTSGEIVVCPAAAKKEAGDFDRTAEEHTVFLVIHGMLHLAGYTHGSKMESAERRLLAKYF